MTDNKFHRVLVVEDNPGDARLLHEMLHEAASARTDLTIVDRLGQALQCLAQEDYDIVLLDLGLPDGQGLDTFLAVNELGRDVPIIVLTGTDDQALARKAVRRGAQDYLVKGHFNGGLLVRSVNFAMERKQAEIRTQRLLQETTLFGQIAMLMASAQDTSHALQEACARLADFLRVPQAGFAVLNPERTAAEVIADYRPVDSPSALGIVLPAVDNPAMDYVLEHQIPLAVVDAQTDPRLALVHDVMRQRKVASILIVPVAVGGQVLGTLGFDTYERHTFTDSEIDLVQRVAGQMGQVVRRKQAEEALQETYDIIRMSPAVAFLWRNDKGWPVEYVTENVEAVFGYTREEFTSGRVQYGDLVHPDDLERVAREVETHSQQGRNEFVHEPYRIVTKDGRVRWLDDRTYIRRDEDGRIPHYQGIVLDVTERREAEEALRASEERHRLASSLTSDYAYAYRVEENGNLVCLWVSGAEVRLTGFAREELLDRGGFEALILPEDMPFLLEQLQALRAGREKVVEYRIVTKDGGRRWVRDYARPEWDMEQGRTIAIYGAVQDITERKRAEARLQASLRDKELLLKEIHHRVKNNLQVISSLLELQLESIQDPQIVALFQASQSRIQAMGLIHEKLYRSADLANIEAPAYYRELVDHLLNIYGNVDQSISAVLLVDDIALDVDTAVPCGLIVNELVSNALKHAFPPDLEHDAVVRVELRTLEADRLALTVSDNGVGLPPALQLDRLQTLGLQLVEVLVQQLGGTIQLERRSGTSFAITFPVHGKVEPNGETI